MLKKLDKSEIKAKRAAVKKLNKADIDSSVLKEEIIKALEDGKADDIQSISLAGKTSIADYIVVASGTSSKHIYSLADNVLKKLKAEFKVNPIIDGKSGTDWVVIDAYDVIVHLFHPETRALYDIEKIWQE